MPAKVIVALCGLALFATSADAQDDTHAQLARLVRQGDDLLARALAIVRTKPATRSQVDIVTDGSARQWDVDENAFQAQLDSRLDRYRELSPDMREGVNRLVSFAHYAFARRKHITFCEDTEADWDLVIAAQLLQHARMASEGHADPEWHPDVQSDPKVKGDCR